MKILKIGLTSTETLEDGHINVLYATDEKGNENLIGMTDDEWQKMTKEELIKLINRLL